MAISKPPASRTSGARERAGAGDDDVRRRGDVVRGRRGHRRERGDHRLSRRADALDRAVDLLGRRHRATRGIDTQYDRDRLKVTFYENIRDDWVQSIAAKFEFNDYNSGHSTVTVTFIEFFGLEVVRYRLLGALVRLTAGDELKESGQAT